MPTTTNFGWTTPADTDLVKDGALAIRTLGNGIDTSMVDLKGGTTGQVLSKASNTDMDFTWVAQDDSNAIQNAIVDAKGDLITATAADTPARLAVGTNGQYLTADSTASTGLKWVTPATSSSGLVLIKRGTFSGVANTGTTFDDVFTSTYVSYLLNFEFVSAATLTNDLEMLLRNTGPTTRTTNYKSATGRLTPGSTTSTYFGAASDDFWQLTQDTYGGGYLFFNRTNSSLQGFYYSEVNTAWYDVQMQNGGGGGAIGFQLRSSSSNITGQVSVYGLAQS